jgi:hypothetical protein
MDKLEDARTIIAMGNLDMLKLQRRIDELEKDNKFNEEHNLDLKRQNRDLAKAELFQQKRIEALKKLKKIDIYGVGNEKTSIEVDIIPSVGDHVTIEGKICVIELRNFVYGEDVVNNPGSFDVDLVVKSIYD